ncbi:MAG: carboxypeptidase regulatory-like domain-containing protein [Acidobacteria bacterium]|nr:carboxypeptidase regulatory-like domain-containing protein [Acidobacteriota bacterium]
MQAIQAAQYEVSDAPGSKSLQAINSAHRFLATFGAGDVTLFNGEESLIFRLAGIGYGNRLQQPSPVSPVASENRAEYHHDGFVEWYVNEPSGLEHGLTLARRPGASRQGESLVLSYNLGGSLRLTASSRADAMEFRSPNGRILRYAGLRSWDAHGRTIPSRMELQGSQLRIIVDDAQAEYPLTVDPTFTQQAKLTVSGGKSGDRFGNAVAISGDIAIVGASNETLLPSNSNQGFAYVFVRSGTTWSLQQKLAASDGTTNDLFGFSVALNATGDRAVVGAIGDDSNKGSAYIYTRSGSTWTQEAKLTAFDGVAGETFGSAVAINGNTILIGAAYHNVGSKVRQGAVYVFFLNTTWALQAQLLAADGAAEDAFGRSVALQGDTALIGAPVASVGGQMFQGAAYVFQRTGSSWAQQAKIGASDGAASDLFGISVALSGDTALIGSVLDDIGSDVDRGSAYLFGRSGTSWSQSAKLVASDGRANDQFGNSVALEGGVALIGAYLADASTPNENQGAAYVFTGSGSSWSQLERLAVSDPSNDAHVGDSVALSNGTLIVGAANAASATGAAYVFTANLTQTVTTSPTGLAFTADLVSYTAPQTFSWLAGSSHSICAYSQDGSAGTRYVFTGWSNGVTSNCQTITAAAGAVYSASFNTEYYLTTAANPAAGGSVTPVSGWYASGTVVPLTATAALSYTFQSWTGATGGASTNITMDGPKSATANFVSGVSYAISGQVTSGGSPLSGVTLTLSGSGSGTRTSDASGNYSFTGLAPGGNYTVTPTRAGYAFTPANSAFTSLAANQTANFTATAAALTMTVNRSALRYGATVNAASITPTQDVILSVSQPSAAWTAVSNRTWLQVTPGSGTGTSMLSVSIVSSALPAVGTYTGAITITATGNPAVTATINCTLTVLATTTAPFGSFDTPTGLVRLESSFAVTGWALDDIGVSTVKIYRDPVSPEPPGSMVYIGDAVFVPGTRPDVESAYPNSPRSYRGGWGYMLLSYFLPNGGNGNYKLYAIATDIEGKTTNLGSKSITVDNANATKPFGAIDTPGQGETVGGANYVNFGWTLTPQPGKVPVDGSTIFVYLDGAPIGNVTYNLPRSDIDTLFPTYANRFGAVGYRYIDTTQLSNGIHTIAWSVTDNLGRADGVGSRFFWVFNPGGIVGNAASLDRGGFSPAEPLFRTGYDISSRFNRLRDIEVQELERVELRLPEGDWSGYELVGGEKRSLPAGSSFDPSSGVFQWQLGPGFLGDFHLEFSRSGEAPVPVNIHVGPKSTRIRTEKE